jgi:altronate dehydratase
MKKVIGILAVALISTTISCKENVKQESKTQENMENMENRDNTMQTESHEGQDHSAGTTSTEREILQNNTKNAETAAILDAYFEIKNGLVADSKENTAKGGNELLASFSKFDMSKLSEEAHTTYLEIQESAKEHAEHIVKSDIDHQREHFEGLSTDITDLVALLGTNKVIYQDFCPMVNNNKGALWLSEVKEIKNPYFGSKMLTCGSVKKQIN